MNKLTITRESIRPNNTVKVPHQDLNKEKGITQQYDALSATQPMTASKNKNVLSYERGPGIRDSIFPFKNHLSSFLNNSNNNLFILSWYFP